MVYFLVGKRKFSKRRILCEMLLQRLVISWEDPWPLSEVLQTLRGPIGPSLKSFTFEERVNKRDIYIWTSVIIFNKFRINFNLFNFFHLETWLPMQITLGKPTIITHTYIKLKNCQRTETTRRWLILLQVHQIFSSVKNPPFFQHGLYCHEQSYRHLPMSME